MRKYALVNNNIVTSIKDLEDEELSIYISQNNSVIDITDIVPQPQLNYVLNGNKLEIPQGFSNREQFEIELNKRKSEFGSKTALDVINKFAARNKILNKNGTQIAALITQLLPVKLLLDTGALGTARYSCVQLKTIYTEYEDIFDYIINEINSFEAQYGL